MWFKEAQRKYQKTSTTATAQSEAEQFFFFKSEQNHVNKYVGECEEFRRNIGMYESRDYIMRNVKTKNE